MDLITGGSGYFGSLLRDRLLKQGREVRVFDVVDVTDRPTSVEFFQGDIRNLESIRRASAGCSVIYHCVAQVPLAKNRHLFETVNVNGTQNLLSAAEEGRATKVIYLSSSAVFGAPKSNPVTEATTPTPAESYGRAKLEGERLCRRYVSEGLDVTVIRPRTILGHGRLGIFQVLFDWVSQGYNVPVLGKGDNLYQFIHADDLADACIRAAARPGATIYNCGTDRFESMRRTLEALCEFAGTGSRVRSLPMRPVVWLMHLSSILGLSPLGPYHALMYGRSLYFDISKARAELHWQPRFSNKEMLIQSYQWYLANRDAVLSASGMSHHRSAVKQGILGLIKRYL